ncbi:four-helix bundle copper-binding protein [Paraburkholderia sp. GAS333]|uniref:four-helix bundle copper-binding protein n=1 Tax=Paraburkholderia sp. GAS333 TaxID=3156279 RepID=UPI003D25A61D
MERCIRVDLDCAAICRLTSTALSRSSPFTPEFRDLCARLCDACADECSRHSAQHCQVCGEACRACAEACRADWLCNVL